MITEGLEKALRHIVEETMIAGSELNAPQKKVHRLAEEDIQAKVGELSNLIRAEAINLADKIIGKDQIMHSVYDSHGEEVLNHAEKAVYDFQVKQRVELAKYQNLQRGGVTGPEALINQELSSNEE